MSNVVPPDEQWLKTTQVAEMFGVKRDTVVDWCKRGLMKASKTPTGQWRITRQAAIDFGRLKYVIKKEGD